jgi:hypothetical protein
LDDGDTGADKALEAQIPVEATAGWQNITLQLRQAFFTGPPCIRGTQEADVTGLIDHQEVLDRVALLAAVIFWLVLGLDERWSGRSVPSGQDEGLRDTLRPYSNRPHRTAAPEPLLM